MDFTDSVQVTTLADKCDKAKTMSKSMRDFFIELSSTRSSAEIAAWTALEATALEKQGKALDIFVVQLEKRESTCLRNRSTVLTSSCSPYACRASARVVAAGAYPSCSRRLCQVAGHHDGH
jgi:hypothetical protein